MEQRIGSNSQPLEGAGFDPAFIPGLTSPVSGARADAKGTDAEAEEPRDAVSAEREPEPEEVPAEAAAVAEEPEAAEAEEEAEESVDGPVFEASDRRAKIVADRRGVRLALDDQACEFRWDEIGAVETETARFGKRFTITVHTPDRRWYPIEIEADSRTRFAEWDEQLDAVLDAYFEDEAEDDTEGDGDVVADDAEKDADAEKTEKAAKSEKDAD
ncbi:hypothetical protein [Streptomyces sp. YU58]|uniref:hypothetical protein n=1 Tax=Streptomyces sp. SX92 TaxID=3158972 RepID=UPI0027B888CA|nr:hypothetical protein [Streptomyces coralus]WLW52563.1 hypothetical protein QU709_14740 [Streptomyces coralus]